MMLQINRWFVRAVTVMTAMMLVSCATMTVTAPYIPDQGSVKAMSVREARNIVEKYLPNNRFWYQASRSTLIVMSARVKPGGIEILSSDRTSVFLSLTNTKISAETLGSVLNIYVDDGVHTKSTFQMEHPNYDLANAFIVLARSGPGSRAMDDGALHFDATAQAYRDATTKPALPEAARRFKVQAEGAINDKDFNAAADYYEQALSVAPWWPQGHFNRALVLSETGEFQDAIVEMKRYLALVPDAPDARAAQDKIYDWERKAGMPN